MKEEFLKNPPKKYRPIPFWSWNDKLEPKELSRQADMMAEVGMGGYFMHARSGLDTEYLSDQWFECIEEGISSAQRNDMYPWAYDENGWPSGFAGGIVSDMGETYQQKKLRIEEGEGNTPHTVCNAEGYHIYYDVNPFYVDTLDGDVIKEFIRVTHEEYYKRFGSKMAGFFTDEPEAGNGNIPWSLTMPEQYRKEYGEELLPKLPQLFKPIGDYKNTRKKYWRLVTKLFSENYVKQLYDWCDSHDMKLTGHLTGETGFRGQMTPSGACMPNYQYFHIPGIDWLGRNLHNPIISLQVVSAAMQTGKKQILTESYAMCGHNVSFSQLRRIFEWQAVRGVNLLCQHLEGYTMRGVRKRDYPPAMFYQQPWWEVYKNFNDAVSRIGMLIAEGECDCSTLLIHPITTAWMCYDNGECAGLEECERAFVDTINKLESKHIQFHLGDESIMERIGRVEGNKLIIGEMEYTTIVLPQYEDFFDNTKTLLDEFKANGGKIITAEDIEPNPVTDNGSITYLKRVHKDFDLHYFVNSSEESVEADIFVDGVKLDIMTGEEVSFDRHYTFGPCDSLCVLDYRNGEVDRKAVKENATLALDGEFELLSASDNVLTLDFCDCYFDDKLVEEHMPVISVQETACALKRPVKVKCVFRQEIAYIPDNMCLVCETPEIFTIRINGREVAFEDCGYFVDSSFRRMNVAEYLTIGSNEIELVCNFAQSENVYYSFDNAPKSQSIRNKLTYDMEIECIYLTGDFSVRTDGEYCEIENDAVRYRGGFVIEEPKKALNIRHIEKQGYPFFAGNMTLGKTVNITDKNKKMTFSMKGINAVKLSINGKEADTVIWQGSSVDISDYLVVGENRIELTLYNNLRNMLGPHHLADGESLTVRPANFFKGKTVWLSVWAKPSDWNDDYCFVESGISFD